MNLKLPPVNRIVAALGPYVSLLAGSLAGVLVAKANVLGIPGLDKDHVATDLAFGITGVLTATMSHLSQMKWLTGHHIQMGIDADFLAQYLPPERKSMATGVLSSPGIITNTGMTGASSTFTGGIGQTSGTNMTSGAATLSVPVPLPTDEQEAASPPPVSEATTKPDTP